MSFLQKVFRPNVEKLEARMDVNGLTKALSEDCGPHVREAASKAMVKIGAPAVEPLCRALGDPDCSVGDEAAYALGKIRDKRAVKPLIDGIMHHNVPVLSAIKALGEIGDKSGVGVLIHELWEYGEVSDAAADALVKIGVPAVQPLSAALNEELNRPGMQRNFDNVVRALGRIGDKSAVEPLVAAFVNGYEKVRAPASEGLVKIGAPAVEPLCAALYGMNGDALLQAVDVLGKIGDPRSIEHLHAALGSSSNLLREKAVAALGQIGSAGVVAPLIACLKDSDKKVRSGAAEALVKIGTPAVGPLVGAFKNNDQGVQEVVVKMGALAVEPLLVALKAPDGNVRRRAAAALVQIGDARAVRSFSASLKDKDVCVRTHAAEGLAKFGGAHAVEPLCAALDDTDSGVLRIAVEALGKMGDSRAVEPLLSALKNADEYVRRKAMEALGKMGDARAVGVLIAALKDANLRATAADGLVKIGSPAVEALCVFLETTEPGNGTDVRLHAAQALIKLYKSGSLSESDKRMILAQRQRITTMRIHTDATVSRGRGIGDCHDDTEHTDYSRTGPDFPL